MKTIRATARVQLTVEIDGGAPWGEDFDLKTVYKQACESARQTLNNALKPGEHTKIRIIGEPKVTGIITEIDP